MNEPDAEYVRTPETTRAQTNRITIAVIVSTLIVLLACIAACTAIALVFLINAPWR